MSDLLLLLTALVLCCYWLAIDLHIRKCRESERERERQHILKQCKAPCSGSHSAHCESGTDFWVGGDLITYAHSQLRVILNPAALTQMTQNNTEQNVKKNRTQNNTAKKITWVPKYIWNNQQNTRNWMAIMCLCVCVLCTMGLPRKKLKRCQINMRLRKKYRAMFTFTPDHISQVSVRSHSPIKHPRPLQTFLFKMKHPVRDAFSSTL